MMNRFIFWILVVIAWLGGSFGIAMMNNAIFENHDTVMLMSIFLGAIWGNTIFMVGTIIYEDWVE